MLRLVSMMVTGLFCVHLVVVFAEQDSDGDGLSDIDEAKLYKTDPQPQDTGGLADE